MNIIVPPVQAEMLWTICARVRMSPTTTRITTAMTAALPPNAWEINIAELVAHAGQMLAK
jgi:hypothetical protein